MRVLSTLSPHEWENIHVKGGDVWFGELSPWHRMCRITGVSYHVIDPELFT